MKKTAIIPMILSLTMLCSCTNNDGEVSNTVTEAIKSVTEITTQTQTTATKTDAEIDVLSFEEIKQKYPDKTILVWTYEYQYYDNNAPIRVAEVNEHLDEKGYDFAVYFKPIDSSLSYSNPEVKDYFTSVSELYNNNEQIDIIYSCLNRGYTKFIYADILEPLDSYFETEIGGELYELMPKNSWKSLEVNGNIYGVDGSMNGTTYDFGYYVNEELALKYDFDVNKSITSQIDILKEVKSNENCDIYPTMDNFSSMWHYSSVQAVAGTDDFFIDSEDNKFKPIYENDAYISSLKMINELNKNGLTWMVNLNIFKDSFFIIPSNVQGGALLYETQQPTDIVYYNGNTVKAIPVFSGKPLLRTPISATGINSKSEHKDKAFELLALTQTDPYLNNLLAYGVEGIDYNLTGGKVDKISNPNSLAKFANYMICYDNCDTNFTIDIYENEHYENIFENVVVPKNITFTVSDEEFKADFERISKIIGKYNLAYAEDLDAELEKLKAELDEAGVDEITQKVNNLLEDN